MQTNNNNPELLSVLTREGLLINVSVRFWRGCKKLKAEEIGLKPGAVSDRLISLGHKRLLPKEATAALGLIEGRAHSLIESNTFPFLNGLAHFLPNPKLEEVTNQVKKLETEFWKAKADFIAKYSTLRESAIEEWKVMARKLVNDPDQLVATIEAAFPLGGKMDRFFGFDMQLFQISVPERLGVDLVTLEDQQQVMTARQQAAHDAAAKIRNDTQIFVSDCVAALREQTAKLCTEMLQSIETAETGVHQKTLNRLIRFIDQFKQLNFANDTEMENQLESVRRELLSKTAEEYRDSRTAKARLVAGLAQLGEAARQMAKADTRAIVERFGELGRRKFHLAA